MITPDDLAAYRAREGGKDKLTDQVIEAAQENADLRIRLAMALEALRDMHDLVARHRIWPKPRRHAG